MPKIRNPSVAHVSLLEPPTMRRAANLVLQQLAQLRRIALEAASARRRRARSAKQAAVRQAEAHVWAAQAVEEKLRVIQRHARARALAKAARIKAEKKRAKKERQKAKRAAVWALPGHPRNARTLRRKRPGVLCGAFACGGHSRATVRGVALRPRQQGETDAGLVGVQEVCQGVQGG